MHNWLKDHPKATLLVVDLETTGLNADLDEVLEVALIFVEALTLVPILIKHVVFPLDIKVRQALLDAPTLIWDMHTKSGLLAECARVPPDASPHALWLDIDNTIKDFIADRKLDRKDVMLMGNSPHGVDIPFMSKSLAPLLGHTISHRVLDMTAASIAADLSGVQIPDSMRRSPGSAAHRALDDCFDCLSSLLDWRMMQSAQPEVRAAFMHPTIPERLQLPPSQQRAYIAQDAMMLKTHQERSNTPEERSDRAQVAEQLRAAGFSHSDVTIDFLVEILKQGLSINNPTDLEALGSYADALERKEVVTDGDKQA